MDVRELRPGLWRWTAPHPDWRPEYTGWGPDVASVAVTGAELVLIDPLVPGDDDRERFWQALDRDVERDGRPHVLLTVPWHRRSAAEILMRYEGARLWLYEGAEPEGLEPTARFGWGDELPGGLRAFDGHWMNEAVFWLPEHRALVTGDSVLGAPGGGVQTCPDSWLPEGMTQAELRDALRPLLELPIEVILPAHGEPVLDDAHAALARALEV
ncbi:MAG: MBL fold metallo-hydrolase [Thermoleophilia bacterium]|nr:MBL fold metallo-hydrolase [Thermoleophilia bacterium]